MTIRGGTDAWGERIWCKKQESLRSYEMEHGLWQETLGAVTPDNNLVMSRRQVGSFWVGLRGRAAGWLERTT